MAVKRGRSKKSQAVGSDGAAPSQAPAMGGVVPSTAAAVGQFLPPLPTPAEAVSSGSSTLIPMLPDEADPAMIVARNAAEMSLRWAAGQRALYRESQSDLERLWRNARWSTNELRDTAQGETSERSSKKPRFAPNLLRQIVQPLTYLYDGGARRCVMTLPDAKGGRTEDDVRTQLWREAFWDFCDEGALDAAMDRLDRMVRIHGTALTLVEWHSSPDASADFVEAYKTGLLTFTPGTDGVRLRTLPPHRFEVLPDEYDARRPRAVIFWPWVDRFSQRWDVNVSQNSSMANIRGLYWDESYVAEVRGFRIAGPPQPHGLGCIPAFVTHNEEPQDGFWSWGIGGEDCVSDLKDMARMWREYLYTAKCSRGTYWTNGQLRAGSDSMGPDMIVCVDSNALDGNPPTLGSLNNSADLGGMRVSITTAMEAWARSNNIPPSLMRLDEKTTQQSGRALVLQSAELEDDRPARVKMFARAEAQAMKIAGIMLAVARRDESLRLDYMNLRVEHQEYVAKLAHADMLAQVRLELDLGLASKLAALRDLHPGVPDEELIARLPLEHRTAPEGSAATQAAAPPLSPKTSQPPPAQGRQEETEDAASTRPPASPAADE